MVAYVPPDNRGEIVLDDGNKVKFNPNGFVHATYAPSTARRISGREAYELVAACRPGGCRETGMAVLRELARRHRADKARLENAAVRARCRRVVIEPKDDNRIPADVRARQEAAYRAAFAHGRGRQIHAAVQTAATPA